jgi:multidrug efflux pump subunit AcrA (membrane-fusion protein)
LFPHSASSILNYFFMRPLTLGAFVLLLCTQPAHGQSIRDHVRLKGTRTTTVTEAQATELTLTVTAVSVRPIQVWVRVAGTVDESRKTVTAHLPGVDGKRLRVGQRARVFSPESRSRMYQGNVSQVVPSTSGVTLKVTLMGLALEKSQHYIVEVVTEDGEHLSVPNEAIIDREGHTLVYVQEAGGEYTPREIKAGVQGELFTQVLDGLKSGEQVVTIGSFFIDAEHKLKGS